MKEAVVLILAGQSNAVGVGHTAYLHKHFSPEKVKEFEAGYPRVLINYYSHDKKSGGFVPTRPGCTELSKDTLGPEVGMAERLTEQYPDREFFIVKCAVGGSSLWRDWLSPLGGVEYDPEAYAESPERAVYCLNNGLPLPTGWCYNELVKLTRESLDILIGQGYTPMIRGFCWMQGEADASDATTNSMYAARYDALLRDFSSEFGAYMKDCVFADGGVSEIWPFWKEMNAFKAEYAATHENCVFIDTVAHGLSTKNEPEDAPDVFHYDLDAIVQLGRLFADAMGL